MTPINKLCFSIPEFCKAHNISRAKFYLLQKDDMAPQIMQVGRRVLISKESAHKWRRKMEKLSSQNQ